ncbi:MAG: hypothetical protein QM715_18055 [Nibricoccus sp.]
METNIKSRNKIWIFGLVVLLLVGVFLIRELQNARDEEALVTKQIAELRERMERATAVVAGQADETDTVTQVQKPAANRANRVEGDVSHGKDPGLVMLADPELRKAYMVGQYVSIDKMYADFFQRLHSTGGDVRRLRELIAEKWVRRREIWEDIKARGFEDSAQLDVMRAEATADVLQEIDQVLGPENAAAFRHYEETDAHRGHLKDLRELLANGPSALDDSQVERLVELWSSTAKPLHPNLRYTVPDSMVVEASHFLTRAQMEALSKFKASQQAKAEYIALKLGEARFRNGSK